MVDEVTLAIAGAVAGKMAETLTDSAKKGVQALRGVLRRRFTPGSDARAALDEARDADGEDEVLVGTLADHIGSSADEDTDVRRLLDELRPQFEAHRTEVTNTVSGNVRGSVVQAGTIDGDLNFGR